MELTEFYTKLEAMEGGWQQLTAMNKAIRRHEAGVGSWCPITAVAESETGTHYTMWEWGRAAIAIGLDSADAQGIVDAADRALPWGNKTQAEIAGEIRKQLLKATGLQEWPLEMDWPQL